MKTRKFYYFLVAILALNISIVACSGDDGEIGTDGLKGEQGIQGVVGPAGADGSIMYSSEGEPAAETGIEGDYYCDSATGMLYGPKTENASWEASNSFSLKGQNGENGTNGTNGADGEDGTNGTNGTDGSKILSGNAEPTDDDGTWGDYYLNKETYTLYGPKNQKGAIFGNVWGMGLMLKGADGNANVKTFKHIVIDEDWGVYTNSDGSYTKTILEDIEFTALNEDIYENGVILIYWKDSNAIKLLPMSSLTSQKNYLTREGYVFKNPGDGRFILRFKNILKGLENTSELLSVSNTEYRIKLITGQAAVQLKANKDNQVEFNRLVGKLAE